MTEDKGILIKNIYYMLTYDFHVLRQSSYKEMALEEFENIHDLFAGILAKGIAQQLKQGLYREYISELDDLALMRGKLHIRGTIGNKLQRKQKLSCEYDELSENNLFNQILKSTADILLRQPTVKAHRKNMLKKVLLFFNGVDDIEPSGVTWNTLRYQKGNQSYRMMLSICRFIMEGLLLTTDKGNYKMADFLDEQRMHDLYQKFVLEYYRYHHPRLYPSSSKVKWALDDGPIDFLPNMQTDITLRHDDKTLIIDTKYYARTMQVQERYDSRKLHSGNMYQIFTYVKNQDAENTGNVSGMLLYAKTEESVAPDSDFTISGSKIGVKTLDLNIDFSYIESQLDNIVELYFGAYSK